MVEWSQLMAGFKATGRGWALWWAEPGAQLHALHPATLPEGGHGEALVVPRLCWASCPGKAKAQASALSSSLVNLESVDSVSLNQGSHLEKCNPLENLSIQFNEPSVNSR